MEGFGWGFLAKDAPWAVLKAQVMAMNVGGEVMSEYDKLLKELELVPSPVRNAAGLAIEALVKARAECERQYQAKVEEVIAQMNRAEAAEAEVERLRAALHSITLSYDERCGIDHATLARSALEAKP